MTIFKILGFCLLSVFSFGAFAIGLSEYQARAAMISSCEQDFPVIWKHLNSKSGDINRDVKQLLNDRVSALHLRQCLYVRANFSSSTVPLPPWLNAKAMEQVRVLDKIFPKKDAERDQKIAECKEKFIQLWQKLRNNDDTAAIFPAYIDRPGLKPCLIYEDEARSIDNSWEHYEIRKYLVELQKREQSRSSPGTSQGGASR